jgi:hypothetical protein
MPAGGTARVTVVSAPPGSGSEIRVLRYLPTHLSAPEIAGESARTLGLLAPSAYSR